MEAEASEVEGFQGYFLVGELRARGVGGGRSTARFAEHTKNDLLSKDFPRLLRRIVANPTFRGL
jgi:hypothetical protein